ncbi:MAG: hypothetical protein IPJ74_25835 [Saprospiraceae bacterium]|nr:hypothetical protein [Saprospiraceae bacterium]
MRIHLKITPSKETIPFNHLPVLAGVLLINGWGPNEVIRRSVLVFFPGCTVQKAARKACDSRKGQAGLSAPLMEFLSRSVHGILASPQLRWGCG